MEHTLLLNATYEPLKVISWKRAITLLFQGKVEVLEVHDKEVHGVTITFLLPSVLRLLKRVRAKDINKVKFSRANIFARDNYKCQYCGEKFDVRELTFDHVIPVARGGKKSWDNIVTACWRCNNKKSGNTPASCGMHLIKQPSEPKWLPHVTITIGIRNKPENWRDYLYWNLELDQDSS